MPRRTPTGSQSKSWPNKFRSILRETATGRRWGPLMTEIIAIANQKGGVGKTTTAVNMAAALATLGHETLLLDMDPQGNATSGVGFDKTQFNPSLYNVLVELLPLEKTIKASALPKLHVAGANADLSGAEIQLVAALARESRLRGALPPVKPRY